LVDEVEHAVHVATQLQDFGGERQKLINTFNDQTQDFKYDCVKKKVVEYMEAKSRPTKQLNARAKENGVDVMDTINGTVQFSAIGTTNIPLSLEELVLHGLVEGSDFKKKMGVKELAKILKKKMGLPENERYFHPKSTRLAEVCNGLDNIAVHRPLGDGNEADDKNKDDDELPFAA
jgi:hypothetical protein